MSRYWKTAVGVMAIGVLAGCLEETGSASMAPAPSGPPFIEGSFSASNAAVTSCRDKLSAETAGGVTVVGSEFSQANSAVYMRVGANGAPWRCLVADDGSNPSLMFVGDEGAA